MKRSQFLTPPLDWEERDWEDLLRKTSLSSLDVFGAWDLVRLVGLGEEAPTLAPLLLGLAAAVNEGSLCLPIEEEALANRLQPMLDPEEAAAAAREARDRLRGEDWAALLARDSDDYRPLRKVEMGGEEFLYFQKYDSRERSLIRDFSALTGAAVESPSPHRVVEILRETLQENPIRRGEKPVDLNLQQRIALVLALSESVAIVSGGPGTGKTSIAVSILRAWVRAGVAVDRIRLAAPTGRAANRLSESIRIALASIREPTGEDLALMELQGATLHRLLDFRRHGVTFGRHRFNPIPADLIVVDEVSMVDVCLMADLAAAVAPGTRLVLLGDKDQLPSVEAGAVLGNLLPGVRRTRLSEGGRLRVESALGVGVEGAVDVEDSPMADRVVILDVSYRSEARILRLAERVNQGEARTVDLLENYPLSVDWEGEKADIDWPDPGRPEEGGFRWIEAGQGEEPRRWAAVVDSWIDAHFLTSEQGVIRFIGLANSTIPGDGEERLDLLSELFDWFERSRILCLVRKGPFGVEWVNARIVERMRERIAPRMRGEVFPGLPILILQNEYSLGVYNGDVGVILRSSKEGLKAYFPRGADFVSFPLASLPRFEPAYAVTVHKSQGSEYDRILMVLPEDPDHRLLTREIVYTGLTRAKSLAVLYGRKECVRAAVERKIERVSARSLWSIAE